MLNNEPQYLNNNPVYSFYFNWNTGKLSYKKLSVVGYDYTDGFQLDILDEYKLIEEQQKRRFIFFKKKKTFHLYRIKSHLISDDKEYAKIKFLYHFLKTFNNYERDNISYKVKHMILNAKILYDKIVEKKPDLILKAITDKISTDSVFASEYWRY